MHHTSKRPASAKPRLRSSGQSGPLSMTLKKDAGTDGSGCGVRGRGRWTYRGGSWRSGFGIRGERNEKACDADPRSRAIRILLLAVVATVSGNEFGIYQIWKSSGMNNEERSLTNEYDAIPSGASKLTFEMSLTPLAPVYRIVLRTRGRGNDGKWRAAA